jgi:sodium-dependent dicarboxylate transporter 2/3/5
LTNKRLITLIAGPMLALLFLWLPAPDDMKHEAWRLVALATWMVVW